MRLERTVLEAVYRHVLSLAQSFFSRFTTGDLVRRFGEVNEIKNFLTESAVTVLLDLLTVASYTALMLYLQPMLAGWYLAVLVASAGAMLLLVRPVRGHTQHFMRKFSIVHTHVIDSFKGIEPVKAMALESGFGRWFTRLLLPSLQHASGAAQWSASAGIVVQFFTAVNAALLLWLGAGMILEGQLSLGQLVAMLMLAQQLTGPFLRLLQQWAEFQRTIVSLERVGDLLEETPEAVRQERKGASLSPSHLRGAIEFDDVSFRYDTDPKDADRPVIDSLSLKIAPGEVVGIVGRSGCGKSTIARLLLQFHEPSAGRILIDGVHLRDFDARALRREIGLVTQEAFLYSASIKDNICCGREGVSEQDIIEAAQAAGAYEFISRLPYGFETLIGEQGMRLSGGQAQRIAIARALCTRPQILIFDEATAALDPLIEQEIHERLREVIKGRTTIIIAHRLHTLRRADRIVVLDRGRLVEQGGHDELMGRRGLYERMFTASPDWRIERT
jgi:ABC-type bacteriocin/lantibiotic exporter with double-glycine peptidase domain